MPVSEGLGDAQLAPRPAKGSTWLETTIYTRLNGLGLGTRALRKTLCLSAASLIALVGCVEQEPVADQPRGLPVIGSPSDLSDFEGARAGQAEMGIQALGYELIRTEGLTAFWFNRSTGACARITTDQGRYADVTMLSYDEC